MEVSEQQYRSDFSFRIALDSRSMSVNLLGVMQPAHTPPSSPNKLQLGVVICCHYVIMPSLVPAAE